MGKVRWKEWQVAVEEEKQQSEIDLTFYQVSGCGGIHWKKIFEPD